MKDSLAKISQAIDPRSTVKSINTRRTIQKLADQLGLVYFGAVDQRDDEHRLIRGMTTSNTHRDDHYCVGTFQSYDVAITIRSDHLHYPDKRIKHHEWTIVTVDLKTSYELPHMFIAHDSIREMLLAKYSSLAPVILDSRPQNQGFPEQFTLFSDISKIVEIEGLLTPNITGSISTTFGDLAIEIVDNTILLYSSEAHPSKHQLEIMLKNGIWLAEKLDESARRVYNPPEDSI
ncbi:hypothetical protein CR956_00100 [Candidatus Saccharibacteria bacterium]|nr:MAG: hypothetical protein CR956_00100 [Candidatus Saccharibacteria bacterium]